MRGDRSAAVTFLGEVEHCFVQNPTLKKTTFTINAYCIYLHRTDLTFFNTAASVENHNKGAGSVCVMWLHKEGERREMKREMAAQSAGTQTQLGYGEAVAA